MKRFSFLSHLVHWIAKAISETLKRLSRSSKRNYDILKTRKIFESFSSLRSKSNFWLSRVRTRADRRFCIQLIKNKNKVHFNQLNRYYDQTFTNDCISYRLNTLSIFDYHMSSSQLYHAYSILLKETNIFNSFLKVNDFENTPSVFKIFTYTAELNIQMKTQKPTWNENFVKG